MKKVLVTGGNGFVGFALARYLLEQGLEVRVIGRNPYPHLSDLGIICFQGDICNPASILNATVDVDTVFHVAAKAGVWGRKQEYYSVNVQGTQNVLAGCLQNRVPVLVYTSTPSVVFDGQDIKNGNEELPYASKPLCHYAASKIEAEKCVLGLRERSLKTCAIRPHLVWGPGDTHLIPRLVERGRTGQLKKVGSGNNKVDITYIENVVHAHVLAAKNLHQTGSADRQAFFIGQENPVVLWEWVNTLFQELNIPLVNKRVSYPVAYGVGGLLEGLFDLFSFAGEPKMTRFVAQQLSKSHWFNHDKAKKILGYTALVSTAAGLERLLQSMREQPVSR
ncbi:MAG: 3-beta hydroxysteroid dehydrogenase [Desulfobulbus propionicus]|nr:MAG: 3-beta hydroxysteroid dehydrogenase [Desulfobulbus propionicus]